VSEAVVTVGTFDGVHLGHQMVIARLLEKAAAMRLTSVIVTFDRHPLTVVRPEHAPPVLTTQPEKQQILAATDADMIQFLPFTAELAEYAPEQFVDEILIARFGMKHLVIGYDHGFGKGRAGDVETLRRIGLERGFTVDVVAPYDIKGEHVSSSRIRSLLLDGDIELANAMLGRPYSIRGRVVQGEGRGRQLDMPTANLQIDDPQKLLPKPGIYAVTLGELRGVLHLGPRPTFEGAKSTVEVHIFDFNADIYHQTITVELRSRIRDIVKFENVEDLRRAMHEDGRVAREKLALRKP
jgi:riboflavin kinase / FMN adenylyltransferase